MKIAIITDSHFGIRNDREIFIRYMDDFLTNHFFPYLKKENIKRVLHLGDIFDRRKYVNFKTLYTSKRMFFGPAYDNELEIDLTVGNHDMYNKNHNQINSPDLLAAEYDNITVHKEPAEITIDGLSFLMVPWICPTNYEVTMDALRKTKAKIIAGHLELQGFRQNRGRVAETGFDADMFSNFEMVLSGHYHHKSSENNVHYLGSPCQFTWADYNDPRGFHIFDTTTRELQFIENPIHPFKKIYYDDKDGVVISGDTNDTKTFSDLKDCFVKLVPVNKNDSYAFSMIQERIETVGVADLTIDDGTILDFAIDESVEDVEDTMTILQKYIMQLDFKYKKKLEDFMFNLYNEALSVE